MKEMLDFKILMANISNGQMKVSINGKVYHYVILGDDIRKIQFLKKKSPGKALSYLKKSALSYSREED